MEIIDGVIEKMMSNFLLLEFAIFPEWQKANKKKRNEICKKLGELEARLIIKKISEEVKKIKK